MTIRVLIADDQEIVRTGLTMILDAQPGIEVVGEAGQFLGDYWNHRLFFARGRDERPEPLPAEVLTVEATVRDFCRRLVAGGEMPITVVDGLRTIEIAEACYASARTDSVITLAVPGPPLASG